MMKSDITKNVDYGIRLRAAFKANNQNKQKSIDELSEFINNWVDMQVRTAVNTSKMTFAIPTFIDAKPIPKRGPKFNVSDDLVSAIRYDYEVRKLHAGKVYLLYSHLTSRSNIYEICSGRSRGHIVAKQGNYHSNGKQNE